VDELQDESQYNRVIDDTLLAIEEAVDASGADIDYENVGGILTLLLPGGAQLILNRQTPVRQLWLAAPQGGFHFDHRDGGWVRDSDGAPLAETLSGLLSELCGETLALEL